MGQKKKQEAEEKRARQKKARQDFKKMLQVLLFSYIFMSKARLLTYLENIKDFYDSLLKILWFLICPGI